MLIKLVIGTGKASFALHKRSKRQVLVVRREGTHASFFISGSNGICGSKRNSITQRVPDDKANALSEINGLIKLKGYNTFYRIRFGNNTECT